MKKIMMAWDGSETAAQAFAKAAGLAAKHGAELHVVSVAQTQITLTPLVSMKAHWKMLHVSSAGNRQHWKQQLLSTR